MNTLVEAEKNEVACYHAHKRKDCWYFRHGNCRCDDIVTYNAYRAHKP